jgi:hypothetical protein
VRDQVSHPYKTTGKIIFLCILIFVFLDSKPEDSTHPCPKSHIPFPLLKLYQRISAGPRLCQMFRNVIIFYGELLAPLPTPKLEGHPLSAVRDFIFAATLHIRRPFLHPQPEDGPCRGDRDTQDTKFLSRHQQNQC